jgi:2-polyprenyl-3-methyl-5-hydroxy-6-metoxy-1,4-benzoquinol methylase
MDVVERLSFEAASEFSPLACEHTHRYQFAAALCGGLRVLDLACGSGYGSAIMAETASSVHGVDIDVASIDIAAATIGKRTAATFEAVDALDCLERPLADQYDMIVCFEGLEHLRELARAVSLLADHARSGVKVIASVPNSEAFEESNPFHVTDFGYHSANELLKRLSGGAMLYQHLLEGSLICCEARAGHRSQLVNGERAEPEFANHFIIVVNVDEQRLAQAQSSETLLVEAPVHYRYMRDLERANLQLRLRNNELTRKMLANGAIGTARAGSAAASFVASLQKRVDELEGEIQAQQRDAVDAIAQRDEMILAQRRDLLRLRQDLVSKDESAPRPSTRLKRSPGKS